MQTKLVYVLTSNENDSYLEQALLSIYSARKHNPDASIYLVVDGKTCSTINGSRALIRQYLTDVISVDLPANLSNMQKSRYLKTKLREIVDGDFLYIDTDTIVADSLADIDDWDIEIGAVPDTHLRIDEHLCREEIRRLAKLVGWEIPQNGFYFNGGLLFVKDTQKAHELFNEWHRLWQLYSDEFKLFIDMPPLAKANELCGYPIQRIPDIYNCQIIENGIRYLHEAKIIHYFASNIGRYDCPYLFRDSAIYSTIKEEGITEEIKDMLDNPKSAFLSKCTIIGGNQSEIYRTPIAGIGRRLSLKFPGLNRLLDKFL